MNFKISYLKHPTSILFTQMEWYVRYSLAIKVVGDTQIRDIYDPLAARRPYLTVVCRREVANATSVKYTSLTCVEYIQCW